MPANQLKARGVLVSVVGIGKVNHNAVYTIASEPSTELVTSMTDYNALTHVVHGISANIELCHVRNHSMYTLKFSGKNAMLHSLRQYQPLLIHFGKCDCFR